MKFTFKSLQLVATLLLMSLTPLYGYSACPEKVRPTLDIKGEIAMDRKSGLIWRRCIAGTRWNGRTNQCVGEVNGFTQNEALALARHSASGWRIPSAKELASLRLNTCSGPKIDARVFPNVASSDFGEGMNFWTSTSAISADTFYYLDFTDGSLDFHSDGFSLAILLVKDK